MRVFVAHSHADKPLARQIAAKLRTRDVEVFLDEASLPTGDEYDVRIRRAVHRSDLMVFVLSEASTSAGAYALTELGYAKARWKNLAMRVLPVLASPELDFAIIDADLAALAILRPKGNASTEAADRAWTILRHHRRVRWARRCLTAAVVAVAAGAAGAPALLERETRSPELPPPPPAQAPLAGSVLLRNERPAVGAVVSTGSECAGETDTQGRFVLPCTGREDAAITVRLADGSSCETLVSGRAPNGLVVRTSSCEPVPTPPKPMVAADPCAVVLRRVKPHTWDATCPCGGIEVRRFSVPPSGAEEAGIKTAMASFSRRGWACPQ